MDETVEVARRMVASGSPHQHVAVNAAKVIAASRDPRLATIIRSCDLVSADGMGVVWASRVLGVALPERVAGIDLFARLVGTAASDCRSVYFLGAKHDVVSKVVSVFREQHPSLIVAGFRDGYWDDDEEIIAEIKRGKPDYLFVAIPSPRKEFWLNEHLVHLDVPFVMGVGGSFDVVAGVISRAPTMLRRTGLEWSWRLGQEPRRMWRRYLGGNAAFVRLVAREWRRSRS